MARDKGFFDIEEIEYAIFETGGKLSVLPKSGFSSLTANDMQIKLPKAELIQYLVVDGKVAEEDLSATGHDKAWLYKGLKIKEETALKNILLASYDVKSHNFIVHYKDEVKQEN